MATPTIGTTGTLSSAARVPLYPGLRMYQDHYEYNIWMWTGNKDELGFYLLTLVTTTGVFNHSLNTTNQFLLPHYDNTWHPAGAPHKVVKMP